ncbi:sensor histidine kinase [Vagococcus silagei]|uniref:GHKL domain-containing protein n=1 Tax=Vagococcus silagei TaxID=2508885 RepID=A0A4V3TUW7_9ENTE|nr:GHKL domain-containing protein [Vagococcus silagei]THB60569.1 GHKL domain-containing protein [Vagococcus silagei]
MLIYLSLSLLIKIIVSYSIMEKSFFKLKKVIFFFFVFLFIGLFMLNQTLISNLILFLSMFLFSINENGRKNIFENMLIILLSFFIPIIINVSVTPLEKMMYMSNDNEKKTFYLFVLLEIFLYLLIGFISYLVSKYYVPYIIEKRLEKLTSIFLLFSVLIFEFFLIQKYLEVSQKVIIIVGLSFLLLIYILIEFTHKKEVLEVRVIQQEIENDYLEKYSNEITKQYDELRKFKHDYINILSSLDYFINIKDYTGLENYYLETIRPTNNMIRQTNKYFYSLDKIKINSLKSILAIKIMEASEKKINLSIEIQDEISTELRVSSTSLVRMLGIILDNSIEELTKQSEGLLEIGVFDMEMYYLFIVKNSISDDIKPLHILKEKGFSTKGKNRGLGLFNLDELSKKEEDLILETEVKQNSFIQKIMIKKEG